MEEGVVHAAGASQRGLWRVHRSTWVNRGKSIHGQLVAYNFISRTSSRKVINSVFPAFPLL